MKILFLTPWYPDSINPNHGVFVRDQALAIARNHKVWVVCAKIDYKHFALSSLSRSDATYEGLNESRIRVKQSLRFINQFNFFVRVIWETLKIARRFRPDIVHGNIGYPGSFWAWAVAWLLNVPYVVTEHTRITNNFRSAMHRRLTVFGLRRARRIVAVSEWHANEIFSYVGKKPVVIHNVIRFSEIPEPGPRSTPSEFQIGFLGGLHAPVKGLDVLLDAAGQLSGQFKLHIGGDGTLLESYKEQAKALNIYDKCIFYGRVGYRDVMSFMRRLHIFVSASRWETFGIAPVEALASGVPVVATDSGGPREFVESGNGLLVPLNDPVKMREAIEKVMRNYDSYDPIAISTSVRRKFSIEIFVKRIGDLYKEVLAS